MTTVTGRHGPKCCQPCNPRPDNHPKLGFPVERHRVRPGVWRDGENASRVTPSRTSPTRRVVTRTGMLGALPGSRLEHSVLPLCFLA